MRITHVRNFQRLAVLQGVQVDLLQTVFATTYNFPSEPVQLLAPDATMHRDQRATDG